jgi:pimeloyl-ACP methyl ester carboxylesterase
MIQWNLVDRRLLIRAATHLGLAGISCTPFGVHKMSLAYRQTRAPFSLARKVRTITLAHPYLTAAAAVISALALSALANRRLAKKAVRDNPPSGRFLMIDGVRLHYLERGVGEPLVLLHGNGSMIQDFDSSGLIDLAAKNYRVIVFDRPGFGHSDRPRDRVWTPSAQADLINKALHRLDISRALVLGHSWGASVAVALAVRYPTLVRGLVLASGYYYPTARTDVPLLSVPALPLAGDVICHTVSPIASRLMWPILMKKIFGPQAVPCKFGAFPKEMAVRPSQIQSSAAESALMIPNALKFKDRYSELKMPVSIVAGEEDRLISIDKQSRRLHEAIAQSSFHPIPGNGHMVHQTATRSIMAAIDEVSGSSPHSRLQTPARRSAQRV